MTDGMDLTLLGVLLPPGHAKVVHAENTQRSEEDRKDEREGLVDENARVFEETSSLGMGE